MHVITDPSTMYCIHTQCIHRLDRIKHDYITEISSNILVIHRHIKRCEFDACKNPY